MNAQLSGRRGQRGPAARRNGLPIRYYPLHDGAPEIPGLPAVPVPQFPAAIAALDDELPQVDVRLVLCPLCAADLCGFGCFEGPCKCACRDGRAS
jgi:hypothetical protein